MRRVATGSSPERENLRPQRGRGRERSDVGYGDPNAPTSAARDWAGVMSHEAKPDRADSDQLKITRLAEQALALAVQLPDRPCHLRLRSGSCEVELEWPTASGPQVSSAASGPQVSSATYTAPPEQPSNVLGHRSGRHRRPQDDDDGDSRNFSLLTG